VVWTGLEMTDVGLERMIPAPSMLRAVHRPPTYIGR
jgi:hypothetical protein